MNIKDEFEKLRRDKLNPPVIVEQDVDPELDGHERHDIKGFNVLILTSSTDSKNRTISKKNPTIIKLEKYCEANEIPFYTAFADTAYLKEDGGNIRIYNVDDAKGHKINRDKTIVIARRGVMFHRYSMNLMTELERYRFCFLNERKTMEICEDKYYTMLKMMGDNIPIPKTSLAPTESMIETAHQKVGGEFPLVVKTLTGTQGIGVFIINDALALKSTLQTIWQVGNGVELMFQEYIESDFDIRVHVIGGEVIASMRRDVVPDDFRSNVHLGGEVSEYEMTEEVAKIAKKAAKAVKGKWVGVDIMFDKDGNPYVLEVNSSPGTDGIEEITKEEIIPKVMEYISDGNNWSRPPQEIGVLETIEIEGLGELVARFDTGNSANSSSLHAEDIKVDGRKITWVTGGVEMSGTKAGAVRMKSNDKSDKGQADKRPTVYIDITFEGVTYKKVKFNLNDRSHKSTPVLINKDFMIRSGSVINPGRIFAVTDKPKEIVKGEEEDRDEN